jgi:phosphoglycerate-specific signal transduction histidine kinase
MNKSLPDARQLSHEIKRSLTHLQSYAYAAQVCIDKNEPEKAKQYLAKHDKTVLHISALTDDAFDLLYSLSV